MNIKPPASASDLASIVAVWAVALIGCRNILSSGLENYLPRYYREILKPDSPIFGISNHVQDCVTATVFVSFILFFGYDYIIRKLDYIDLFLIKKKLIRYKKYIFITIAFITVLFFKEILHDYHSSAFIFFLFIYAYTSKNFSYLAKLAIVPALILIFWAFSFHQEQNKNKNSYIVSTACDGFKNIKVLSATKIGNFVELKTETDTLLININTITRIQEIKESSEDIVKTPQPAEKK